MKIRNGFVSNSSSTSFYFDSQRYSSKKLYHVIETMLEAYNMVRMSSAPGNSPVTVEDICDIQHVLNRKHEAKQIAKFKYGLHDKQKSDKENNMILDNEIDLILNRMPRDLVVVNSTTDNSIPYFIQLVLEEYASLRQHWG